jgi:hypothetical protein
LFGAVEIDVLVAEIDADPVCGNLGNDTPYGGQGDDILYVAGVRGSAIWREKS